ncbi:glutamate synthase [NADPH] large chain [Halarchaeum acidiphilum MH1-52-1]|uniref:Glutamate synthase [NADPH] large chain n=1 Tax=Halarchaeum acidiphilum MH1-52-1 TaxID=1261545 RepID=U2YT57_9EURY|nr:glutamate synthase large subunit [Halarchaeum acidiphilum]GAD51922.1 glutamate synthase [NADPH] large chain [Halarchaeum acidiphilum MH1-52-1]
MTEHDARSGGRRLADPAEARSNCGVGVVMDLDGEGGHDVVRDGLDLLANLEHRGTTGAEKKTGDGAGILLQIPDGFFADEIDDLPEQYAVGSFFLPQDDAERADSTDAVEAALADHGLDVVAWRDVPTDNADLGQTALDSEPHVAQLVVTPDEHLDDEAFDRALYIARRAIEKTVDHERFYVCSLDRETLVYKGLLKGDQVRGYYPDLRDERLDSTFVLVHARFSTNTLGAWHLAHPYRNIVHNGEFNTIKGNVNWMRAREADIESEHFSESDLDTVRPVIPDPDQSDTASVDNALELLMQGGRDLPHALRMLIPEAWEGDEAMDDARQDWYDYHASLIEPWDGPALVVGTDGERVGAALDRNGLRPCRYEITTDNTLVMGSEAGAVETPAAEVAERGRLQPGQLFLADPAEGRVIPDDEVFDDLTDEKYGEWVDEHKTHYEGHADDPLPAVDGERLRARQAAFGYTHDELNEVLEPMLEAGKDPVGSMGDDTPLAVLSKFNLPLFSYFRQMFAQVTNPPIDYIREDVVTSLQTRLGRERNLLDETPEHADQVVLDSPVLTDNDLGRVRDADVPAVTVDITYDPETDLETAVADVRAEVEAAIRDGAEIVVLSDRDVGRDRLAIPSLLATSAVHHHLVREGLRTRAGLVVESGDPRTVHQLSTLVGYGAGAVNPYLAMETVTDLVAGPDGMDDAEAIDTYVDALEQGLLKVMSKMGISTVESYRGAQIFEAVGLDTDLVDEYFEGTTNKTSGIGLAEIEEDLRERHAQGYGSGDVDLERQGEFTNTSNGRFHQWNPQTVNALQAAVRSDDYEQFGEFSELIDDQTKQLQTLRGLLAFDGDERESVPLSEVEPAEEIVERFSTAAMSLGSLSPEAHENNAKAMNSIGAKANTGEGGEPPERFNTERECKIKQVASGRFGVTSEYLSEAEDLQIKMAQGSKPGEGGHLPGSKVNEMIAGVRCSTPGVGLISPPPQHDIYSIEDLKQLIYDLRSGNPDARVHVKLVSEAGIGTIAAGVAKAKADCIHISGHAGGTGASPKTSIKHAGLPWELGLAEANQLLRETGLRSRVTLRVDGGLKTGRDVAIGALLGAEEFAFGTGSLVTSGCVMARQCHANTCPVGIATQSEKLRERFPGQPEHVVNFMMFVAQELREIMAELGFTELDEMIGRTELLDQREVDHPKARTLDLSRVIADPVPNDDRYRTRAQDTDHDEHFDWDVLDEIGDAVEAGESVHLATDVTNVDRTVGGVLSNAVSSAHGGDGLPNDTVSIDLEGTAGQSFGAWLAQGVTLDLTGAANDYVGKGLSGGKIVVNTPNEAPFDPATNTLIGNVALYGATDGELYVNGVAGERFGVRNSGAKAVVEGVGDHGCEYMTGGVVAVLGDVGRNFAAGMSGGVAYVYDPDGELAEKANPGMVSLEDDLTDQDEAMLRRLVENHETYTDSARAAELLQTWETARSDFVKVMPDAYAEAIAERPENDARKSLPAPAAGEPEATGRAD